VKRRPHGPLLSAVALLCAKFIKIKVSAWQDDNDDILLHQWRISILGPNRVGGEGLIADNSLLSVLSAGVGEEDCGRIALDFTSTVTTKPNNKMTHPFVTVLMHWLLIKLTLCSVGMDCQISLRTGMSPALKLITIIRWSHALLVLCAISYSHGRLLLSLFMALRYQLS
jgi:hypothetical protein